MISEKAERRAGSARRVVPLLAATGISVTGDGAFITTAPLLAAALTHDPVGVASVTAGFYVPWLIVGLPAGALADRWPRRRVMVAADVVRACLLGGLVTAIAFGVVSVPLLVVTVVLVGVAQCFFDSAAQAVIPAVVGRDKDVLAHVNGRFWSLDTVGRSLVGPPLGSALFALARELPFVADGVSFVASATLVRSLPRVPVGDGPHGSIRAAVGTGLRHLLRTRELRILALSMGAYNFAFNASMAIFVLYSRDLLKVPVAWYGALLALSGIGGVAAGWRARQLTKSLTYRQTMAMACATQALAWVGIALTANVWVAAALLACLGAGSVLSSVAVGSARQELTPDALLGRVVSAFRIFGLGAAGLGALAGGAVASTLGLSAALVLSASILAVDGALTWPFRRR